MSKKNIFGLFIIISGLAFIFMSCANNFLVSENRLLYEKAELAGIEIIKINLGYMPLKNQILCLKKGSARGTDQYKIILMNTEQFSDSNITLNNLVPYYNEYDCEANAEIIRELTINNSFIYKYSNPLKTLRLIVGILCIACGIVLFYSKKKTYNQQNTNNVQ